MRYSQRNSGPSRQAQDIHLRPFLITASVLVVLLFLIVPLVLVFSEALKGGVGNYLKTLTDPHAISALKLTMLAVVIAVPLNTLFGTAIAWYVTRHNPKGKSLLLTLIDLPFTISPVVSGLMFILLFGSRSLLGSVLMEQGVQIVFAVPGIILVTAFVTFPFITRELIPVMEAVGSEEEQAAVSLGARPPSLLRKVTLPNVRWGLLYGIILCTARAVGEFGAVSVVSGHIRGRTNTAPLHIEVLFNEYQTSAAFAVASVLTFTAILTLLVKEIVQRRIDRLSLTNGSGR